MLPRRLLRRLVVLLAVLGGLAVPTLAVTVGPSGAQPPAAVVARAPETSSAHPFSQPRYLPVRNTAVLMDCYQNNDPGSCPSRDWQLNLLAPALNVAPPVYAMGAGRFSLLQEGTECGPGDAASFGTMVQIDHGGGVVSRYAHLNNNDVARYRSLDGELVAVGQRIGTMGNTGARGSCDRNYLDFWVQRGPGSDKFEIETLIACVNGAEQVWPQAQYSQYPTWNQLPKKLPGGANTIVPAAGRETELPDDSCLPDGAPATPDGPAAAKLDLGGSSTLLARWAAPPDDTLQSVLSVQIYRVPLRRWDVQRYLYVTGTAKSVYLRSDSGMATNRKVRVLLAHRNSAGWSRWSDLSNERVVGTPPSVPVFRSLRALRTSTGGAAILSWKYPTRIQAYPVTGWVAQVRLGSTGRWRSYNVPPRIFSFRFNNLSPGRRYQVRVAARSGAGLSPFLTRNVTPPR